MQKPYLCPLYRFADVHDLAVLAAKLLNQFQIKKQRTLVND